MRKKERQIIIVGLILFFVVIGWWVYYGGGGGFVDIINVLSDNSIENIIYEFVVSNFLVIVDQVIGYVFVSFQLVNEEYFNIFSVQIFYVFNVVDLNNVIYIVLNVIVENGIYKVEILSKFGDVVYYKVKVVYDIDKIFESDVQSIIVIDMIVLIFLSVSFDYNSMVGIFSIDFNVIDNDVIVIYYVYYVDFGISSIVSNIIIFIVVNVISFLVVISNVMVNNYYVFYFVVEDISGNKVMFYNEISLYIVQVNVIVIWLVVVIEQSFS